jgi:hypothetical protein
MINPRSSAQCRTQDRSLGSGTRGPSLMFMHHRHWHLAFRRKGLQAKQIFKLRLNLSVEAQLSAVH